MGGGAAGTAALMEQQFGANGMYAQNAVQQQMQQQQQMRGFDPSSVNMAAQQMPGGGMGGTGGQMAAMGMMNALPQQTHSHGGHHQSMAAMRQQHQQTQQMNQQQQYRQQQNLLQQQQGYQQSMQQQQVGRMQPHHETVTSMPPPQARQALHSEMMSLSMHGTEEDPNNNTAGTQQQQHPTLRPSLVKRGSAAARELGMQQGTSNMSLMSEFSSFGNSAHGSQFAGGGTPMGVGSMSMGMRASSHADPNSTNPYNAMYGNNQQDMDRRHIFAKMKYSRPPSDRIMSGRTIGGASAHSMGDGMPDFHMVESQLSLYSNLSGMTGNDSKQTKTSFGDETAGSAGNKKPAPVAGDLLGAAGSRHSIMSGLSRISDTSEVHSIFSDLSRKIGNVSTRSIAMSEISGIDAYRGGDDSDSTPSFGEADAKLTPGGTMDFDVF